MKSISILLVALALTSCGTAKINNTSIFQAISINDSGDMPSSIKNRVLAMNLKAIQAYKNGSPQKSKNLLQTALLFEPENQDTQFNYGYVFYREHDYATAVHFFKKLYDENYTNSNIQMGLIFGESLCKIKQTRQGTEIIDKNMVHYTKTQRIAAFKEIQKCIEIENNAKK